MLPNNSGIRNVSRMPRTNFIDPEGSLMVHDFTVTGPGTLHGIQADGLAARDERRVSRNVTLQVRHNRGGVAREGRVRAGEHVLVAPEGILPLGHKRNGGGISQG